MGETDVSDVSTPIQIKSFISGNMAHRKTKHRNTLIITNRQKGRQKKANYIYKLQANYINYINTNTSFSLYSLEFKKVNNRATAQRHALIKYM